MIIIPKRQIWTRQPQNPVAINGSHPLGKQRWAMVHVPGISLFGTANPVVTAQANAVIREGVGGRSLVYTTPVANGGFTYGANPGLQLNVLSGVAVFYHATGATCNIFGTSWDNWAGGGFMLRSDSTPKMSIVKHDKAIVLESSNSVIPNRINAVAWSYNSSTGRAVLALNGILTSATSIQTLSHNTVATLAYYADTGAASAAGSELSLLAVSPDECFDDRALIDASLNPWAIFAKRSRHVFVGASGGGSAAELAGSATATAAATASLTTQIPLTGAAASVATASGGLTTAISLAGASASVAVANGELTAQIRLAGAALAQVLANGALTTEIRLSGTALMQALAAADLTTSPSGLAASAAATATASGQISTGILLLAEASCIAISEGGLTTAIEMTGSAVSVSTATGDLTVTSGFSAAALAQVTASGTLSTQIRLDAAAVMHAIAAASLTTGAQIVAFYDELDAFYGDFSVQCSANGMAFNGILDTTDVDQFGAVSISTHRLRYPAVGSAVTAQADIMVAGVRYKVIEIPRRISRSEMVAELVKQP